MGPVNDVGDDVENVIVVPSTVIASLFWKPAVSEAEGAVPDKAVDVVIGCGVACWSFSAAPVTEPLPPVLVAVPAACEKPNAASAPCAFGSEAKADNEKLAAFGVLIVMAPPLIDEVPPVIELIAESRSLTLPDVVLMTYGLPDVLVAALDEKLIVVPSTAMLSPFWKPVESESEPAMPDSAVAPVMFCGVAC